MRALVLVLLLSGCATIGIDRHVEGWPTLKVTTHEAGFFELQARCWDSYSFAVKLMIPVTLACATADLDKGTCEIHHLAGVSDSVMAHEYEHCKGGAHDEAWQQYFDEWKARQTASRP